MTESRKLLVILSVSLFFLYFGLGSWGLLETSEARYAEIGKEMVETGDFIHPNLLGIHHYHKPPITYYITTLGYKINGINEMGARFFLPIAIGMQLILIFLMGKLLYNNPKDALLAVLIYFSFPIVLISGHNLTTDAYLTTFVVASAYFWLYFENHQKKYWSLYLSFIILGLAMETKPVAIIFVFPFIISYYIFIKRTGEFNRHYIFGLALFIMISLSWFIIVEMDTDGLLNYYFNHQLLDRALKNSFHRGQPFWYYIPIIIGILVPWMPLVFNRLPNMDNTLKARLKAIGYCVLSIFIFFSIAKTKLALYILPSFWMIALLIAPILRQATTKIQRFIDTIYLLLSLLILLSVFYFFKINEEDILVTSKQLIIVVLLFFAQVAYYLKGPSRQAQKTAIIAFSFACLLLVTSTFILTNNDIKFNSIREIARYVEKTNPDQSKKILVYNHLLNSAPFYFKGQVLIINDGHYTAEREIQFEKDQHWKQFLIDLNESESKDKLESIAGEEQTYLLVRKNNPLPPPYSDIKKRFAKERDFGKWILYFH